jgi:hypothetical protein
MNLTHGKIEARAYGLYLERNGNSGSQLEDWLKAEKEVKKVNAALPGKQPLIQSIHKPGGAAPVRSGK